MRIRLTPLVILLLLIYSCDRENIDILLDEQVQVIDPTVTDFTPDHVRFDGNQYVYTSAAHASECDLFNPQTGDFETTAYLITNLTDLGVNEPEPTEEGDFFLLYDQKNDAAHYAHVMVRIADTLTLACPFPPGLQIDLEVADGDLLAGRFVGEFFVASPYFPYWESIGDLSGDFHLPMVPCQ